MEEFHLLSNVAAGLAAAFVGGLLARSVRLSPVVGYLAAGIVISPFTPGYEADTETLRALAELGVIFLMFGVGLHFNVRDLLSVKKIAVPGAIAQIVLATALGAVIGLWFGLPGREALVLGLAVSIASTVVLVRSLEERGLVESIHGRVAIGWLIVQDIATVLFLVLLPALEPGSDGSLVQDVVLALAKAAAFIGIMLVAGTWLVPRLLAWVAKTGSRELFILSVVAGALGIATGAAAFGLSVALGAFVAGVVVSETETSHQAAADVIPLREAFAVLFFVSVGMLLDPGVVLDNLGLFAAVLMAVLFANAVIAFGVAALFPYPARTALTVGAGLAQLGEFSFIIADESLGLGLMRDGTYNVVLAVAVVAITLNPLAFWSIAPLERGLRHAGRLWRLIDRQGPLPTGVMPASGHAVILGYGRVGELTGHALGQLQIPFGVVEADIGLARRLNVAGIPAVWGDAASPEVLRMAAIHGARLVVIAVPDESTTMLAIANVRRLNADVPVIVRARAASEMPILALLGASEVVVPEYEGGLELMRRALVTLGFDADEVVHFSNAVRDIHYSDAVHAHSQGTRQ
ncbi:MAG: sodium:proton antiporter [Anaerolinea sp.]|nr:sodium:proton antiporter [Anaerolinea sp.]